jgi:DNA (cytosine-5)-methyltransferase 1
MKILNLYAGIGGNRKLWGDEHQITAVEYDQATADVYNSYFPNDVMIVADAHEYLLNHYKEFDFIWSSPPCPTHSDIRRCGVHAGQYEALYPDMTLYQEIILLKNFLPLSANFCVENVKPYYTALIPPDFVLDRHFFWSNFKVPSFEIEKDYKSHQNINGSEVIHGFSVVNSKIAIKKKALRNMCDPRLGLHILNCAMNYQEPVNYGLFDETN